MFHQDVGPYTLAMLRSALAFIGMILYALLVQNTRISVRRSIWAPGIFLGLANLAVPMVLFTLAYQHASAGFVGITAALIPVATAGIAHMALSDEPLHARKLSGLLIALIGVVVLLAPGESGLRTGGRPMLAFTLSAAAVLVLSMATVYARHKAWDYSILDITLFQFLMASVAVAAAMFAVEGIPRHISLEAWSLIVYLVIVSTILPFVLFFWLLRKVSAGKTALSGYLVPPIAVATGIVFLDEGLTSGAVLGALLIGIGVFLTEERTRSRRA